MKHAFLLFVFLLLFVLGVFFLWRGSFSETIDQGVVSTQEPVRIPPADELTPAELSQSSCENSGGRWNECGSACRTQPEAPCIELCVPYCECQTSQECPSGFSCGDVIQEVGICL
ncbi:MAG: hypothetical protein UT30_C0003G0016 [Candidatus Uhrbacteria bacterium GW2011_GWF2_39_13]|uniref:Uncharacterized protein n=1 Tax=Candidatus Uhrbacteria bacterium GW2011_GWF2_39_13 TaxID=1618995 RepID=A0A0G0QT94_9BACT|nr:MAG: hypothetical protein UT30_C0003G0016 [Candidatus Uhrbacteria bacterium GW2011_GWF2_39_13]HAU66257.1 hypothetical protein [Candidatus Uhrbacteria bacterium]